MPTEPSALTTTTTWVFPKLDTLSLDGCTTLDWDALRSLVKSRLPTHIHAYRCAAALRTLSAWRASVPLRCLFIPSQGGSPTGAGWLLARGHGSVAFPGARPVGPAPGFDRAGPAASESTAVLASAPLGPFGLHQRWKCWAQDVHHRPSLALPLLHL
ncbi:hypothetical protein BC826DRAFT_1113530 [Russula brevipes]|nr:hypothetical protein BC826DRAFT_1113530 [Russula brevipes]